MDTSKNQNPRQSNKDPRTHHRTRRRKPQVHRNQHSTTQPLLVPTTKEKTNEDTMRQDLSEMTDEELWNEGRKALDQFGEILHELEKKESQRKNVGQ
jgi:hypothetical protein